MTLKTEMNSGQQRAGHQIFYLLEKRNHSERSMMTPIALCLLAKTRHSCESEGGRMGQRKWVALSIGTARTVTRLSDIGHK